jgi:NTP pyrophosphatase (non-canonical NTP hydrolase)
MADKYAATKEILSNMASIKMEMNSHKGSIENIDSMTLVALLGDEVAELREAVAKENMLHILEEAADVMNYLTALIHKETHKYRNRKNADK